MKQIEINRYYFTMKDCLSSFGNVSPPLEVDTTQIDNSKSLDSKPNTARTQSFGKRSDVCQIYQDLASRSRQSKRINVDPAPGQYFTRAVTAHAPEVRMEGRREVPLISSSGSTTSSTLQTNDVKFGYWNREPRHKPPITADSHLGPGAYDVPSFIAARHRGGHSLDAGKPDNSEFWIASPEVPGPGQYTLSEGYTSRGYTIAKTRRTLASKFNPDLGPGKYEIAAEPMTNAFQFSMSPRFSATYTERMNREAKTDLAIESLFTSKEATSTKNEIKPKICDFVPERRRMLITRAAKLREHKIETTKRTKVALLERRRSTNEQKLQDKLQRFEERMLKPKTAAQALRTGIKKVRNYLQPEEPVNTARLHQPSSQ